MMRATKIVATIGPASSDRDTLTQMILAGVDVVRLNFSHGTKEEHIARAQLVREIADQCGRRVAIMSDLQGPKIRVGRFANGQIVLQKGAAFLLDPACQLGTQDYVGLDYKTLASDLKTDDILLLNDGLIVLKVVKIVGDVIHTVVEIGGVLSDHKGINKQGGGLSAPALTDKDKQDIQTALSFKTDYIAVSFPKSASDMILARQLADLAGQPLNHRPLMIAKIERAEAIPALPEILEASDGIMVARGDLAVEVGNASVPGLQKHMIKMAKAANKLTITATQMMESMITNAVPTRAEVSDVANAVLDGTDAVMTSAETAAGKYPVETIKMMAAVCLEAEISESSVYDVDFINMHFNRIDQSIASAALFTAARLQVKAIVALTETGSTVLTMSRHNINVPIFAVTPNETTLRKAALFRNVSTFALGKSDDFQLILRDVQRALLMQGAVEEGDLIVVTWGEPLGSIGGTNALKIVRIGDNS